MTKQPSVKNIIIKENQSLPFSNLSKITRPLVCTFCAFLPYNVGPPVSSVVMSYLQIRSLSQQGSDLVFFDSVIHLLLGLILWATCLNRVAAHKQSHATFQLFVDSRLCALLFYLIQMEILDNILRRKMLHIMHILHIVHILQFLHLFHKYHILQFWHIQKSCILKY